MVVSSCDPEFQGINAGINWPNAGRQPLPEAGARDERTLEAVGCRRLFGSGATVCRDPQASVCEARDEAPKRMRRRLQYDERLARGLGLCLATGLNVLQRCLARQHLSNTHAYVWKARENSVDEVPQFLQQFLAYLDLLTGKGR